MGKINSAKRLSAMFLTMLLLLSAFPGSLVNVTAAEITPQTEKTADSGTLDAWKAFFGPDQKNSEFAGGVWTDKSVFTDADIFDGVTTKGQAIQGNNDNLSGQTIEIDEDNFLVVLSAIANNKQIHGVAHVPTDTMLILDVSGSMNDDSGNNDQAEELVNAANQAIKALMNANPNNRVGVVLYSGSRSNPNASYRRAMVLLPLERYNHAQGEYLIYTAEGSYYYGGTTEYIGINTGVTNSKGNVRANEKAREFVGATYIQDGIYTAMNQLLAVDEADTKLSDGTPRVPVMVLMSDGAPTAATTDYANVGNDNRGGGSSSTDTDVFLTQLTAAYAKAKIDNHYKEYSPLFYTLGLAVGNDSHARAVMNPDLMATAMGQGTLVNVRNNWNTIISNGRVNLGSRSDPLWISKVDELTSADQRYYVDKYVGANIGQLEQAFKDIVDDIILQSEYLPTHVHEHENFDGYITFVDHIGEYMEVKNVKGFVIGDTFYSGATFAQNFSANAGGLGDLGTDLENLTELGEAFVDAMVRRLGLPGESAARELARLAIEHGQLSYTSPTEFSSVIRWYADATGKYLGFYCDCDKHFDEAHGYENAAFIVSSYGYIDTTHTDKAGNLLYCSVNVLERIETGADGKTVYVDNRPVKTGEQLVRWMIPASMIPLVTREFSLEGENLDNPGKITLENDNSATVEPIRLVYEVGLVDEITPTDIHDIVSDDYNYKNNDGTYTFYTNMWNSDQVTGSNPVPVTRGVNTAAVFTPNVANERYYFVNDTSLYARNGNTYTEYTGSAKPSGADYYFRLEILDWSDPDNVKIDYVYEHLAASTVERAEVIDGQYKIPKGTRRAHVALLQEDYVLAAAKKAENKTGTFEYVIYPTQEDRDNVYYVDSVLGNNGKVTYTPATGLSIEKQLSVVKPGEDPVFTFNVSKINDGAVDTAFAGTFDAVLTSGGNVTSTTVTFTDGVANVSLKNGEKIEIIGFNADDVFSVEESTAENYEFVDVEITPATAANSSSGSDGTKAEVKLVGNDIVDVLYTNAWNTDGDLIIRKRVTHPLGSSYVIPEGISFAYRVDLDETKHRADETLKVLRSGQESLVTVKADEKGTYIEITDVKAGMSVAVLDLAGDSSVTVEEIYIPEGFKAHIGGAETKVATVTVPQAGYAVVEFENVYEPENAPVNVSVSGSKNFSGRNWKQGDEFTFRLDYHSGIEGSTWTKIDTQTVKYDDSPYYSFNFTDAFEKFVFDEVGTYAFRVSEIEGTIPGVTYDKIVGYFNVLVTDEDMNGVLEIKDVTTHNEGKNVAINVLNDGWTVKTDFYNTYAPTGNTAVDIDVVKKLVNNANSPLVDLSGYQFEVFTKDADGVETVITQSAITDASGEVNIRFVFDGSDYDLNADAPEFTYYLREIIPSDADKIPGMTYDPKVYTIYVDIIDDTNGNIYAEISTDAGVTGLTIDNNRADGNIPTVTAEFENKYDPDDATLTGETAIQGVKTLNGKTLEDGKFTFLLYETDHTFSIEGKEAVDTKTNKNDKFVFDDITFDKVGTYYYVVTEDIPDTNPKDGITYDTAQYKVTVVVTDNNGVLVADVSMTMNGNDVDEIEFINKYAVTGSVNVQFGGSKEVVVNEGNYTFAANHFGFELINKDGKVIQTVPNGAPTDNKAEFTFEKITYTNIGEYKYTVKESLANKVHGIEYDDTVYEIIVTVEDNGTGGLKATVKYIVNGDETDNIEFVNTYDPTDVSVPLAGDKDLEGRPMHAGEFTFLLYEADENFAYVETDKIDSAVTTDADGSFSFDDLKFSKTGTYYYVVKEDTSVNRKGVTYDETEYKITVIVTDGGGALVADVTVDGEEYSPLLFTNHYKVAPTSWPIDGDKHFTGRVIGEDDNFTFEMYETGEDFVILDGQTPMDTAVAGTDGRFEFKDVEFTQADLGGEEFIYKYYVVKEDSSAQLGGVTYDDAEYHITVKITDVNAELVEEVVSVAKKTSDGKEEAAEAVIFENSYDAEPTTVDLGGDKDLTGPRDMAANEFFFNLFETGEDFAVTEDSVPVQTVKNTDKAGTFNFATLTFDKAGTYYYVITENDTAAPIPGVEYDGREYKVTVTVTDNGIGNLVADVIIMEGGNEVEEIKFENIYETKPVSVGLHGDKDLVGKALNAGEFTFLRYETGEDYAVSDAQTALDSVKNIDANGSFVFDAIEYTEVGTYYYVIMEDSSESEPGVTYDDAVYNVKVVVTDIGGELKAERTITLNGTPVTEIKFENSYKVAPTVWPIGGDKNLTGREMKAGEFTFNLMETDENFENAEVVDTAKITDKNGTFVFEDRDFSKPGTYYFIVKEDTSAKLAGVTYDTVEYHVVVEVEDVDAQLVTVTSVTKVVDGKTSVAEGIVFNNVYDAKDTSVKFEGNKILTGRDIVDGEFKFDLFETGENFVVSDLQSPLQSAENDGKGFTFDEIAYDSVGIHHYVIMEDDSAKLPGVTYDNTKYDITVEVKDERAELVAEVTITKGGREVSSVTFENTYAPAGTYIRLTGDKDLAGRDMNVGEFAFNLYGTDSSFALSAAKPADDTAKVMDTDGTFMFNALHYDKAGTYYYIIKEDTSVKHAGITYDESVYHVTVTVTDIGGALKAEASMTNEGNAAEEIKFTNYYKAAPTVWPIGGDKNLTGREINVREFTFELYETDAKFNVTEGMKPVDTAHNINSDGIFRFKDRDFDKAGTYYFVVKENTSAELPGVTYDDAVYHITVEVTEDTNTAELTAKVVSVTDTKGKAVEAIVFNNKYDVKPTTVALTGDKNLTGREMKKGEFTFELYETREHFLVADGQVPVKTAKNTDVNGAFAFESITYTSEGKHYYVIKESAKDALGGITYDTAQYHVVVDVKDVNAVLKASVTIEKDGAKVQGVVFENTYDVAGAKLTLAGNKKYTGASLADGQFTFNVYEADEKFEVQEGAKPVRTAKNTSDGTILFDEFTYTEEGTYYYLISEDNTDALDRVTYDDNVFEVTVTVQDDGNGNLIAESEIELKGKKAVILFENVYTPKPTDLAVEITVVKTVENKTDKTMKPEGFHFELTDINSGKTYGATSDKDGIAKFGLTFTEDDVDKLYEYTLKEINNGIEGVTYSDEVYEIEVKVTLGEDNKLVAEITVNDENVDEAKAEFVNIYEPEIPEVPEVPDNPDTGEDGMLLLYLGFFILAAVAIIRILIARKKEK